MFDPSILFGGIAGGIRGLFARAATRTATRSATAVAVAEAAEVGVAKVATSELVATHGRTLGRRALNKLTDDIAENGIKEPIKFVEHEGTKYVVDGHHRLIAAGRLGIKEVPAQQVTLPFRGYRTATDLFSTPPR